MNKDIEIIFLGNIYPTKNRANPNQGRVYHPDGLAPTLNCKGGGNLEPFILIGSTQDNAFIGNADYCCTLTEAMGKGGGQIPMIGKIETPCLLTPNNFSHKAGDGTITRKRNVSYIHPTLQANPGGSQQTYLLDNVRIRKLTPKECFRLMGFDDADVDLLAENGISNTQLYKMAGNSIVVNVLEFLFCQIFDSENEIWV